MPPYIGSTAFISSSYTGRLEDKHGGTVVEQWHGYLFLGFMALYGAVKIIFFRGEDGKGQPPSFLMLTLSVYITWIFARSITVCANLGAEFGVVGGLAYAIYWLCIPLTGLALYRLRTKCGADGLVSFLTGNYGKFAATVFSLVIGKALYLC